MPSSEVPHKWKEGKLRMGKTGKVVPHTPHGQKIMEAIMFSERRNEAAHGGDYVSGSERHNPLSGTRRPRRRKES